MKVVDGRATVVAESEIDEPKGRRAGGHGHCSAQ
jgi:hypothetical protein